MIPYKIIYPNIVSGSLFLFTTDSGVEYEVRFARKKNNILHASIVFGVLNEEYDGEEYALTNKGEVFKVMNTIAEICRYYIKEHPNINSYEFVGEPTPNEDENKTTKRLRLYERYLPSIYGTDWIFNIKGNKALITKKDKRNFH